MLAQETSYSFQLWTHVNASGAYYIVNKVLEGRKESPLAVWGEGIVQFTVIVTGVHKC